MMNTFNLLSNELAEYIYEVQNGERALLYAPLKDLVLRTYGRVHSKLVLPVIQNVPDKIKIPQEPRKPWSVTLELSRKCNMQCQYCFVTPQIGRGRTGFMSKSLAKFCLDYVVQNAIHSHHKRIGVFVLGYGECTLNWPVLRFVLEYSRKLADFHNLGLYRFIVTNGVMSKEKAIFLAENTEGINLSWDGLSQFQNRQRPLRGNNNSHHIVAKTASIFAQYRAKHYLRTTITSESAKRMTDITRYFLQFSPGSIIYQPLYTIGAGRDLTSPDIEEFYDGFIASEKIAREHKVKIEFPGLGRIKSQFCSAYSGLGFAVSYEGLVSVCDCCISLDDMWADYLVYGSINNGEFNVNEKKFSKLRGIVPERIAGCRKCFAYLQCRGQCLNTHLHFEGQFDPLSQRRNMMCSLSQDILFERLFQKTLQNSVN